MRTTITSNDVAAGIERIQRERGLGLSEAVNDLVRSGLVAERPVETFRQQSHDLGAGVELSKIGEAIETCDGPAAR